MKILIKRKPDTLKFWVGCLPHWEVVDGRYFITMHLKGAIPKSGQAEIRATAESLRANHSTSQPVWLAHQRKIFSDMEKWLDRAEDNRWLQESEVATMVMEAIAARQQRGDWNMFEFVVMPNHLHLFCEFGGKGMKSVLEDFKRWTGHQATKLLKDPPQRFWQREWFDHWSRSDEEDKRIVNYVRKNPVKAKLVSDYRDWKFGGWNCENPRG